MDKIISYTVSYKNILQHRRKKKNAYMDKIISQICFIQKNTWTQKEYRYLGKIISQICFIQEFTWTQKKKKDIDCRINK